MIVVIPGANNTVTSNDIKEIEIKKEDVMVAQCETPLNVTKSCFEYAKQIGTITIFNPAPAINEAKEIFSLSDIIVLNESELAFFSNQKEITDAKATISEARKLRNFEKQIIIITLGSQGAVGIVGDQTTRIDGRKVIAVDTTGAGDCFVGAMAAKLAKGEEIKKALEYANAAASISVQKKGAGTSMPTFEEVSAILE